MKYRASRTLILIISFVLASWGHIPAHALTQKELNEAHSGFWDARNDLVYALQMWPERMPELKAEEIASADKLTIVWEKTEIPEPHCETDSVVVGQPFCRGKDGVTLHVSAPAILATEERTRDRYIIVAGALLMKAGITGSLRSFAIRLADLALERSEIVHRLPFYGLSLSGPDSDTHIKALLSTRLALGSVLNTGTSESGESSTKVGAGGHAFLDFYLNNIHEPIPMLALNFRVALSHEPAKTLAYFKANLNIQFFPALAGVWFAFEKEQFRKHSTDLARMGIPIYTKAVHLNGADYVFFRAAAGGTIQTLPEVDPNERLQEDAGKGINYYGATGFISLLVKYGAFLVDVGGNADYLNPTGDSPDGYRVDFYSFVSMQVGLLGQGGSVGAGVTHTSYFESEAFAPEITPNSTQWRLFYEYR